MSLFEHDTHKKAGRALVIVSTMTIFLQQCTRPFSEIALLGFQAQITSSELSKIMTSLVCVYGFVFIFRVYQSDIVNLFITVEESTKDRRDLAIRRANRRVEEDIDALEILRRASREVDALKHSVAEQDQEIDDLNAKAVKTELRIENLYKLRGKAEYVFMLAIEMVLPIAFATVALFVPIGGRLCASYTTEISLLSSVP